MANRIAVIHNFRDREHLSGAVITCVPTLGWWYHVSEAGNQDFGLEGIYGPFATRDAARDDRSARCKTIRHVRYRAPYTTPHRATAFVRVENGKSVWRRCKDTIGYAIAGDMFL